MNFMVESENIIASERLENKIHIFELTCNVLYII